MDGIVGFIIVLISFFTLPFRFIRQSWSELSEIGRKKSVTLEGAEELPLLNWLLVLGRALISIGAILIYIFVIIVEFGNNRHPSYPDLVPDTRPNPATATRT